LNLLLFLDNKCFVILWATIVVFLLLAAILTSLFGYIRTFSSLAYIIAKLFRRKIMEPRSWLLDLLHEGMLVNKLERKWNNLLFLQLLDSSLVLYFLPFKVLFDIGE
jgi:hypothetical protein